MGAALALAFLLPFGCVQALGISDVPKPTADASVADGAVQSCVQGVNCGGQCVDVKSDASHCGACGKTCDAKSRCVQGLCKPKPSAGCSDGQRDAFVDAERFPGVAGCLAKFGESSLRAPKSGTGPCGDDLIDAEGRPGKSCATPADACEAGWHLCAAAPDQPGATPLGPKDVTNRLPEARHCLQEPGGAFAFAWVNEDCQDPCGTGPGHGAACCGEKCVKQVGSCVYPNATAWVGVGASDGHIHSCGSILSDVDDRGVLCCQD